MSMTATEWRRGDVVSITDPAHLDAICVLTSGPVNEPSTWLLLDDTCLTWRSTEWVEARAPRLLVHRAALDGDPCSE